MSDAEERVALRRIGRGILDLRIMLVNPRPTGERRAAVADELEALRLARIGVHRNGQHEILRRHGVTAGSASAAASSLVV